MLTTGVEGWLVAPDDPAAAAAALGRLAQDGGLLAETGRAARRRAVATFDARLHARRHLALYRELPQRDAAVDPTATGVRLLGPTPAVVPLLAPPPLVRTCLRSLRRLSR
jgi:plasmid stabilization system protein ParE